MLTLQKENSVLKEKVVGTESEALKGMNPMMDAIVSSLKNELEAMKLQQVEYEETKKELVSTKSRLKDAKWKGHKLRRMQVFGDEHLKCEHEWPKEDTLKKEFPKNKRLRLKGIQYKNHAPLEALRLLFTHDVASPLFHKSDEVEDEGENARGGLKERTIDPSRRIK